MRKTKKKEKFFNHNVNVPFFLADNCFFFGTYKDFTCIGTMEEQGKVISLRSLNPNDEITVLTKKELNEVLEYFEIKHYELVQLRSGTFYIEEIKVN